MEPDEHLGSRRRWVRRELSGVFDDDFPWRIAKQWPAAFKTTEVFFKYVSWLIIIAATKYIKDGTHDWYVGKLLFVECGFFVISLMWLSLYLIYAAIYDDSHIIGKSMVLATVSILLALFLLLFLTNPLLPLDRIIDRLEHRNDTGGQKAVEPSGHATFSANKP